VLLPGEGDGSGDELYDLVQAACVLPRSAAPLVLGWFLSMGAAMVDDSMRVNEQLGSPQCRLVQRGRRISLGEVVIVVVPLVFHGE
jgi:hypothetical protein